MLALIELSQEHIDTIAAAVPGGVENIQGIHPLTTLQEGILFHSLLNEHSDTYFVSTLFELQSSALLRAFIDALQKVIDRHDILRTAVLWEHLPHPVQVVHRRARLKVQKLATDVNSGTFEQMKQRMQPQNQKLDLTRAPLLRLLLARDSHHEPWHALLQAHHLICDYQTKTAVIAEVMTCLQGKADELPMPAPYQDFLSQLQASARPQDAAAFFRRRLSDIGEPTAPFGLIDTHGDGSRIEQAVDQLGTSLAQQLQVQARRFRANPAILVHAALALVVAHTSGRHDVVYGTVLASHPKTPKGYRMLGMSINTLPLRLNLKGITIEALVAETRQALIALSRFASASLVLAQGCSGIHKSAPLFTTILNYLRDTPGLAGGKTNVPGVRLLDHHGVWTNYPITIQVSDSGKDMTLMAQTDRRICPRRMIAYVRTALHSVVEALEHAPRTPAFSLTVLPPSERQQILHQFNATLCPYPHQELLHELFEQQAARTPDAIAVICGDQQLSYMRLNRRANQLAHALLARGIQPDARVCLYSERSTDLVTAMLGILKAGGAYVPMDVSYPRERLRHMFTDSQPLILLTHEPLVSVLQGSEIRVMTLDGHEAEIASMPEHNPDPTELGLQSRHLAYVIYTSGSTGMPKGVAVEHRSLTNLVQWHCCKFGVRAGSRYSSVAAIGFDAAAWEIWPPLSAGATLILPPRYATANAEQLIDWWAAQPLEMSFLPTPLAEFVFDRVTVTPHLRTLLAGGDRLRHRPAAASFTLVNNYGPTEATVVATSGSITPNDPVIHIGQPIANTRIYILDSRQMPVPLGVAGEIHVGGAGIARGYLHRPGLTAERFVADPFGADSSDGEAVSRLYRTGDIGRWLRDGAIEYLGRSDYQVKMRGFRIELGEIETQLARHAQVKDAVVIAREDAAGEKYLVAYFTPSGSGVADIEALRVYLKSVLPEYMVPVAFVELARLPLTANGKLDRGALPPPARGTYASKPFTPPQGRIEAVLAQIWQEMLCVRQVGRQDNYFELGGHSLLAVNSLLQINQALGCSLKVTDIYAYPTLHELAARIDSGVSKDQWIDLPQEAQLDERIVAVPGNCRMPARNILLTGGTGFVGRFLLAQLLEDTEANIHCLVRAHSEQHALARLRHALTKWNLWREQFAHRIIAVPGDLARPCLGIDAPARRALAHGIDEIYHCGTSMNHLETYASAKPTNVDSIGMLLQLATTHRPTPLNYISTLSVFRRNAPGALRVVDEATPIDHEQHPAATGYVASKWVGEKIVMTASGRNIPCNIFRVGLAWADRQRGRYDDLQQGHRLFKSCLLSGYGIERYRFTMPPTPVDCVVRSIVSLAKRHRDGRGVFHISAAEPSIEDVFERCNAIAGTSLKLLPYYDWIHEMRRLHQQGRLLPVVPLIEYAFSMDEASFYERQRHLAARNIRFDCTRTHAELQAAGIEIPALDDDLLKLYVHSLSSMDSEVRDATRARSPSFT